MRLAPSVRRLPLLLLLLLIPLALLGCASVDRNGPGLLPIQPVTDDGQKVYGLYFFSLVVAGIIFFIVEGLILFAVLRYRRKGDDRLPKQTHGNVVLELLWFAIPTVIVVYLFTTTLFTLIDMGEMGPTVSAANGQTQESSPGPERPPEVTVEALGFQWQWTFNYAREELSFTGQGSNGPEMVLPTNEVVHITLKANDVIHAFYVPQFLYKKDVIPGKANSFDVTIQEPGTYVGQCAEFCGLQHAQMFFTVRAVPRPEYDAWVAAEQEKARATPQPTASATGGEQPAEVVAVSASNSQKFDQDAITVPAGTPFPIEFTNNDPAAPHNVAFKDVPPGAPFIGMPIANAGQKVTYQAPAIPAGTYQFFCSVHPNMIGSFTAE